MLGLLCIQTYLVFNLSYVRSRITIRVLLSLHIHSKAQLSCEKSTFSFQSLHRETPWLDKEAK